MYHLTWAALPPVHLNDKYKNMYKLIPLLLMILAGLIGCAAPSSSSSFKPVPPGFLFKGDYLNVHAPASTGWHLSTTSSSGMEFGRLDKESKSTFGAQVLIA